MFVQLFLRSILNPQAFSPYADSVFWFSFQAFQVNLDLGASLDLRAQKVQMVLKVHLAKMADEGHKDLKVN